MGRPIHFEVSTQDIERAKKFYENVLGWEITKWDSPDEEVQYWLVMTGVSLVPPPAERDNYGIDGGMMTGLAFNDKINAFLVTVEVKDIKETRKKVEENGGRLMTDIMTIEGVGQMSYVMDTEGNYFGIMETEEM